jgi:isopenicillin-N N-acyltransferase like protein
MTVYLFSTKTTDAGERGRALGSGRRTQIEEGWLGYQQLFVEGGVSDDIVKDIGQRTLDAVAAWSPRLGDELAGIAEGSGLEPWQIGALNARTEILARCRPVGPGECSTSVYLPRDDAPRTIQTWDWYDHLGGVKLLWELTPTAGRTVRTFTECGVVGKIGVNDAGLGLHFNLLKHSADGQDVGVPVHSVARRILDEASTIDDAIEIARSAKISASTAMTVVTDHDGATDAASLEVSPVGVAVLRPDDDGFVFHTNHFIDPDLAKGERLGNVDPDTYEREAELEKRREGLRSANVEERAAALDFHLEDGAALCCHPFPDMPASASWRTLFTVALDPASGHLNYHDGAPCTQSPETWETF